MSDGIVFIDGDYVKPEEAKMSIFDSGFVWGDVVYDVTSAWNRWVFMLDEHLERFQQSIDGFRLTNPYSHDEMRRICAECVEQAELDNAYIKVQMTRGVSPSQTRDPRLGECQFVAYAMPYVWIWGEEKCREGVNLYVSSVERVSSKAIDQRFKNYDRADLVQSRFQAYDRGCDDSLLCGPDGYLTEGPGYNMFIVRNGKVSTPDSNILEGVTRRSVREICEAENIPYEERKVHPDELQDVDEIFCSTTAGGVMPVTQLDSQPIGNGHKGLLTSRIHEQYWRKREAGWHGTLIEDILNG